MIKELEFDPVSLLVTLPVTVRLADLEKWLNQKGYTFGFCPRRLQKGLTLREALERRIPNRWSLRYGELDEICMAVEVQTPLGLVRTKRVPRSATGPDLKRIWIGSGRTYGSLLKATFRIVPIPEMRRLVRIPHRRAKGARPVGNFLRKVLASGIRPAAIERNGRGLKIHLEGMKEIVSAEMKTVQKL